MATWAQQAPRKAWQLRPGDVFVTPVPLSREFLRYVYDLTAVPPESVAVVEVPPAGAVPLGRAVREAGLEEHVRALAGDRGAALLPTALDASAIAFARDIGIAVHAYLTVGAAEVALRMTTLLNTKTGFRAMAGQLGMRLPAGRTCRRPEAESVAHDLLEHHERVVLKPDRSAGGHGMRFVSREDLRGEANLLLDTVGGPEGLWVVEECLEVAESVSIQMEVAASGARALFSGAMRTVRAPSRDTPLRCRRPARTWPASWRSGGRASAATWPTTATPGLSDSARWWTRPASRTRVRATSAVRPPPHRTQWSPG
ncbi:hypothetical protein [Streptomyces sp. LMG1-1-1.1]|uniref:preATP grasp domain-containing protein n=1 Tax=Streptomyces sp. LMG1-1-1.1 TaxID=3135245 RepID=UPI003467A02D